MNLDKLYSLAAVWLSLCLNAVAQSAQPASRITAPIDNSNRVTLTGNVHPMALARFDRGPAPVSTATGRISLVLRRSAGQQQALIQYLADLQNPGSPNFHKWLSPAQYGAQFGISDSDLARLESWLESQGFKIEKVPHARNVIQFSGTIGQLQSAFHTSMHTFQVKGESHVANVSDPEIPAALAPVVAGVGPLNDFHPKPAIRLGPQGRWNSATRRIEPDLTVNPPGNFYLFVDPADAATIYDAPNPALNPNYTSGATWDGTGVNIGVAGVSNVPMQDLENYRSAFLGEDPYYGSNFPNWPWVIVDGNDPMVVPGAAAEEALLDTEISGGLAPKAKVYLYVAADTGLSSGLFDAIFRAIDDNTVSILSISFGECEQDLGTTGNQVVLEAAEQAAAQGISVVVSAGDNGPAGCDDFDTQTAAQYGFAVNGLASTPYTIAVGGTDFDVLSANFATYVSTSVPGSSPYYRTAQQYIPEVPWNDSTTTNQAYSQNVAYTDSHGLTNIVAGSGGASTLYLKPPFQANVSSADNARDIPDVSLLAGNGFDRAAWTFCSDSVSDGISVLVEEFTDCQTVNGQIGAVTRVEGVGGTSPAAPAFAGILALVSQSQGGARLGQADSILYQIAQSNASVFHDVTTGNNSVPCVGASPNCGTNGFLTGYNAVSGYDLASGLGSVDVKALINSWGSVSLGSTSTTLTINGSAAAYTGVHGASLTLNAGVTPSTATGVAAIIDNANQTSGGTVSGPQDNGQIAVQLTNGSGSVTYNGLPGGTYTVTARYGGNTTNAASTSAPISVTISPEASTTTLTVKASDPQTGAKIPTTGIPYGSLTALDAVITGTAEGTSTQGLATGTVKFSSGNAVSGTERVNSGNTASYPAFNSNYVAFTPGSYAFSASYSGDVSFSPSTSSPAEFTVIKAPTTASATISLATNGVGPNSFNVIVHVMTPANLGLFPTGQVSLTVGNTVLTTVAMFVSSPQLSGTTVETVIAGTGNVPENQLPAGTTNIIAGYSGDANYSSSSTVVTVPPAIFLTNTGGMTLAPGSTGTTAITVTPVGGFVGNVNLTCMVGTGGLTTNDTPTCSIASPTTISGTTPQLEQLTVRTTGPTSAAMRLPVGKFLFGTGAALAMIFFLGMPARRRGWRSLLGMLAVLYLSGAIGCGGSGGSTIRTSDPGTSSGIYAVTVTGSDAVTGKVTATTIVWVTVT